MGEDIPKIPPIFDPVKWYCIHNAWYWGGVSGCVLYGGLSECCRVGSNIIAWLLAAECLDGFGICAYPSAAAAQKLLSADGPYDTATECYDAGCGAG